ncbi:hypothetical protein DSL92_06730 [Billgrantia gudaonensis]|uniref:Uncharacterized protein n=1 Tax=Billgrantia gudaonensis TaxID=376427 RepID=A0A3S0QFT4_9GAMM|nr:hypothetical protein DSL92_06730 [Halomonas gudaonensis]
MVISARGEAGLLDAASAGSRPMAGHLRRRGCHPRAGRHRRQPRLGASALSRRRRIAHGGESVPRRVVVFISSLPQQVSTLAAIVRVSQVFAVRILLLRALLGRHHRAQGTAASAVSDAVPACCERLDVLGDGDGEAALHLHAQPRCLAAHLGQAGATTCACWTARRRRRLPEQRISSARRCASTSSNPACRRWPGPAAAATTGRHPRAAPAGRDTWPAVDPSRDDSIVFHVATGRSAKWRSSTTSCSTPSAGFDAPARDVIVMVPDIDHYAPHIQAVFGQYPSDDARHIPSSPTRPTATARRCW